MNGCIYRTKDNECELWTDDRSKSFCDIESCKDRVMSNADRIRSMSDEELADWLVMNGDGSDYQTHLAWLKEEVDG